MSKPEQNLCIDYIEFPVQDVEEAKRFYGEVFGWRMKDWDSEYASFDDGRIRGGFTREAGVQPRGVMVVLYSVDLEGTRKKIVDAGGSIVRDAYDFPGGKRFHFKDPSGNELAIWSEK